MENNETAMNKVLFTTIAYFGSFYYFGESVTMIVGVYNHIY